MRQWLPFLTTESSGQEARAGSSIAANPDSMVHAAVTPICTSPWGWQTTLRDEITISGRGFIYGSTVTVRLLPTTGDTGILFRRVDLPDRPTIPALAAYTLPRERRTALGLTTGSGIVAIEMVEHILAALAGMGIDHCLIELDQPELPALDGSCWPFVEAIERVGLLALATPRTVCEITTPIVVQEGSAMVAALPPTPLPLTQTVNAALLTVTYNLSYAHPAIGSQSFCYTVTPSSFATEIAPARTFVLEREVAALQAQGIGIGFTAKDLLVFADNGMVLDNQLHFNNECVRHKILDVVGDLALLGLPIYGHVLAHRSGHRLNVALVQAIQQTQSLPQTQNPSKAQAA